MVRIQDYGFILPKSEDVNSENAAVEAAARLGYPVVLKVVSPNVIHKTDVGGVVTDIGTADDVRRAYQGILKSVAAKAPNAEVRSIEVSEMIRGGAELIVGLTHDEQFGPAIMVGLGGIYAQVFHDVVFRLLPINEDDASEMISEIEGQELLQGFRGQAPVSRKALIDLLMKANRMGLDLAPQLGSVDLNPIVIWGSEHRVLDAKLLLGPARVIPPVPAPNTKDLDRFFAPASVALVGASLKPGKIGHSVLDSLACHEYRGTVYPVNPAHEEMMGLRAYKTISEIPVSPDVVIVTVALNQVPTLLEECAEKEVRNMIIISGGGKELGDYGSGLEERIGELARKLGIRVIGCNCIGVFDGESRFDSFFQTHERMVRAKSGPIALITQSGTVGGGLIELLSELGLSRFVSYGNRIDVDEADLLGFLESDARTQVIACYVEGFRDGRKFIDEAGRVSGKKPVVIYKSGRSSMAAIASMSHTGFFGGTYAVAKGAFRQAGLIDVDSLEELGAVSKALAMQPRVTGNKVAMVGNGAGTMVQGIDLLDEYSLELADLSEQSILRLSSVFPPYYVVGNPLDITGSATSEDYETGIKALMDDPLVDVIMPWIVFQDTPLQEDIVERLGSLSRLRRKPIVVGAIGGPYTERMSKAIEGVGVPVYHSVRQWVAAAWGLSHHR